MASNGKWQLAFWIMATICVGGMLTLTKYVIANEVRNITDHKEVRECIYEKLINIDSRLTRIETKLEIK